jgi:hypothetical protein
MATTFASDMPPLTASVAAGVPPILGPVIALVLWSFVMWFWLYATRIPAMAKAKVKLDPSRTAADLAALLPPNVRWKADNYNHLMEQPTLFYAVALSLAVLGGGDSLNSWLAWAYVALRVLHSLVQATVNVILVRFTIFAVASIVLLIMAIRTALLIF